ncbi:2-oxo-4-hydroxy-4-carboxy-5-ureidoimidazoline decarboxylase [Nocardia asteroides]
MELGRISRWCTGPLIGQQRIVSRSANLHSSGSEATVLMHRGIGLDRFNRMPRSRAIHALYECCCNVTWAAILADARPYRDREELLSKADAELLALSERDVDRAFEAVARQRISSRDGSELARVTRERIAGMLGPSEGYPEY